jgi:Zn-dependent protease with chaperone function
MNKLFQVVLVLAYIAITTLSLLSALPLWGVYLSERLCLLLVIGWCAACFSAVCWASSLFLARCPVRYPIREEEDQLDRYFEDVRQRAGCAGSFRLLIEEDSGYNAYATGLRTIVISKVMLKDMSPEAIRGIFAHELGHLVSRDCAAAAAYQLANYLPHGAHYLFNAGKKILRKILGLSFSVLKAISIWLGMGLLVGVCYFVYSRHLLVPIVYTMGLAWAFSRMERIFLFLWNGISRYAEYKQDAYAHQLGYGSGLREVLCRLAQAGPQVVTLYVILMRGSHPVIYNRIRRLEKLEGLR